MFRVFEMHAGNDCGGVAGKSLALRCDQHDFASPTAHAGLGEFCIIVRDNIFDADLAAQAFFCGFYFCEKCVELSARRQKKFAIRKSPAVILHVGKFDARCRGRLGDGEHFVRLVKIAAVQDEIERDGDAAAFEPI